MLAVYELPEGAPGLSRSMSGFSYRNPSGRQAVQTLFIFRGMPLEK